MITYEQRLNSNTRWAFMEGSMHFEKESAVHKSLERIARRLEDLGVPYAIAGAMAMFYHGYRRFTEDVDILVTREGLQEIHRRLEGLGYVPPFAGSKNLRDAESGVKLDFIVAGDYPGDGKPKPVVFPDPTTVAVNINGIPFVNLPTLVQLKLASGTAPGRRKDLGDAQELIRELTLPREFGDQLDPSVRPLFQQLWDELHTERGGPDKE